MCASSLSIKVHACNSVDCIYQGMCQACLSFILISCYTNLGNKIEITWIEPRLVYHEIEINDE